MGKYFRGIIPFSMVVLAVGLFGCGVFDGPPENFTSSLVNEADLHDYEEASGTVELHFMDGEIHVNIEGIPELEEGCMIMCYSIDDSGATALGMVMLEEEEEEHAALILAQEAEHEVHHHGEIEAHAHDLGIELHEITAVECALECDDGSSTTILGADFADDSTSESDEGSGGGHAH